MQRESAIGYKQELLRTAYTLSRAQTESIYLNVQLATTSGLQSTFANHINSCFYCVLKVTF